MLLYIIDESLTIIGMVENYNSIIWTNRYFESGDFELHLPATNDNVVLLRENHYVIREGYEDNAMIISSITIETDVENGDTMIVTGKCLKSILSRRIIWNQTTVSGKVEVCLRRLVTENAIDPDIPARKISRLTLGDLQGFTDTITSQFTGDNLETVMSEVCMKYGLGYDVKLDLKNKKFVFVMYKGEDRSYNQTANPYVVFSNEFENLLRTNYSHSRDEYKNTARIGGEGEGSARIYTDIGNANSDLNRYEVFVDADDISTNDGEISETDYIGLLEQRGYEKLAEASLVELFDGEVEANHTFKLNEDYFLGDIIEVVNEYGIETTPRIVGVIQSQDETGDYTIPIFSSYI